MTRVIGHVLDELNHAERWLTTTDVIDRLRTSALPSCTRSSIGAALRRMAAKKEVERSPVAGDDYGNKQWAVPSNAANSNFPSAIPVVRPPSLKSRRRRRRKQAILTIVPPPAPNASNQGDLIMQIEQGVEAIVAEWVATDKKFSAHDVTKELRDRVNAGTLQVDPGVAGTVQVGGQTVTRIEHKFVRDAVHTLMLTKFDYDRAHNGNFYEYFPLPANTTAAAPTPDPGSDAGTPPPADGGTYDGSSTL